MEAGNGFSMRRARAEEAIPLALLLAASYQSLGFVPQLHNHEEDLWYIRQKVLGECETLVAVSDSEIVGFVAVQKCEIMQLHTGLEHQRKGIAAALLQQVQSDREELELWCFQQNTPARRFYERHGFVPIAFTDGAETQEKLPDVRYRWVSSDSATG